MASPSPLCPFPPCRWRLSDDGRTLKSPRGSDPDGSEGPRGGRLSCSAVLGLTCRHLRRTDPTGRLIITTVGRHPQHTRDTTRHNNTAQHHVAHRVSASPTSHSRKSSPLASSAPGLPGYTAKGEPDRSSISADTQTDSQWTAGRRFQGGGRRHGRDGAQRLHSALLWGTALRTRGCEFVCRALSQGAWVGSALGSACHGLSGAPATAHFTSLSPLRRLCLPHPVTR